MNGAQRRRASETNAGQSPPPSRCQWIAPQHDVLDRGRLDALVSQSHRTPLRWVRPGPNHGQAELPRIERRIAGKDFIPISASRDHLGDPIDRDARASKDWLAAQDVRVSVNGGFGGLEIDIGASIRHGKLPSGICELAPRFQLQGGLAVHRPRDTINVPEPS